MPFKSVSKPITADLPRDVLPSVSWSELPEDSASQAAARRAAPARFGGSGIRNFGRSSRQPWCPHGATVRAGIGGFAWPAERRSCRRPRLGHSRAPLGPARCRVGQAGGGALCAASGKGAPFASPDPSGRALGGAGQEMAARQE